MFRPALAVVWVVAMAAFFLVNHSLVSIVVSLSTGQGFVQSWLRAAPVAAADWAASIAYGLIIAALLVHDQALLPLLVVPIGLTFLGNRAWARSLAQGQRMHSLYAAGRALSNRLGDTRAWEVFAARWPTCSTARGPRSSWAATRTACSTSSPPAAPTG